MSDTIENAILAGLVLTGPQGETTREEWDAEVTANAIEALTLMGERSNLRRAVEAVAEAKVYTAVIEDVKKERSTTRAFVTLKVKPSKWHSDGVEQVRSERSDRPDGRAMAKKLVALQGHYVLIWKQIEETSDGRKAGVIRHVRDLGVATGHEFDEDAA